MMMNAAVEALRCIISHQNARSRSAFLGEKKTNFTSTLPPSQHHPTHRHTQRHTHAHTARMTTVLRPDFGEVEKGSFRENSFLL